LIVSTYNTKYKKNITTDVSCEACVNRNCLIKRNINALEGLDITNNKNQFRCKKGQQFIMEGAPVNGLYFILSGKAKVFRTGINGKEQIVRFAKDGEIIGHRGFGTEEYYSIGAMAIEDTTLCYFSKNTLQQALYKTPSLTYDLMLFYANELNKSESKVKSISQMTVRERIVDTLLYLYRKFGDVNGYLNISLSRRDYANHAGTTEEQAIRVFSVLKKEGLIFTKGKKIGITNVDFLKKDISEHNYFLGS